MKHGKTSGLSSKKLSTRELEELESKLSQNIKDLKEQNKDTKDGTIFAQPNILSVESY